MLNPSDMLSDFLVFELGQEILAMDIANIVSIVEPLKIAVVPNKSKRILGLVNYRGRIVPALDLSQIIISKPVTSIVKEGFIMNFRDNLYYCGVERICGINSFEQKFISHCPETISRKINMASEQVINAGDTTIIVISPEQLIASVNY